jgi:DNA-directed RNA polymerase subunit RPC12/RpoP
MVTGIQKKDLAMVLAGGRKKKLKESWRIAKEIFNHAEAETGKCSKCGSILVDDPEGRPYITCAACGERYIVLEG